MAISGISGSNGNNFSILDWKPRKIDVNTENYEKFGGNNTQGIGKFSPEIQTGHTGKAGGVFGGNATNPNSLAYFKQNILPSCNLNNPVGGNTDPDGNSPRGRFLDLNA